MFCDLNPVGIVQAADGKALANQTYTLGSVKKLAYALLVQQTPSCGYVASEWTIITTSTNNPAGVKSFTKISTDGVYSAGPFTSSSLVGTYTVEIISVQLRGHTFTSFNSTS